MKSCFFTALTSVYFVEADSEDDFFGAVTSEDDKVEGVTVGGTTGFSVGFLSGRIFPLNGSMIAAEAAVSVPTGTAASDWRRV